MNAARNMERCVTALAAGDARPESLTRAGPIPTDALQAKARIDILNAQG